MGRIGTAIAIIVVAGLFILSIVGSIQERKDWEAFRVANHCHVTGRVGASTGWGMTTNGKGAFVTIPAKEIWTCDGGFTEQRDAE